MKYVLVTGGVVSGLGKGVTASSIGVLLKACGHRVTSIKIGALLRFNTIHINFYNQDWASNTMKYPCRSISQR